MKNNDSLTEYHIILNIFLPADGGRTVKQVLRSSDRDSAISKFKYIGQLVSDKKNARELQDWCMENLHTPGIISGTDGLYAVTFIRILP